MAHLSFHEKAVLEELFGMRSGYVMDFSNNSFAAFVWEEVRIDIYGGVGYTEYTSKANKMRQIWENEPDSVVGILLLALLSYCEDEKLRHDNLSDYDKKKIGEMRAVAERLKGNGLTIDLPKKKEESLQTLQEDIANALSRHKPELVLDRLHTFATILLRQICTENGISTVDNKGNQYALHSLVGMLCKKYEQESVFQSSFTIQAMKSSNSLFERYNAIRNDQSYAHDNDVLGTMEAEYAVKTMANLISFIDKAEAYRKHVFQANDDEDDDELPF